MTGVPLYQTDNIGKKRYNIKKQAVLPRWRRETANEESPNFSETGCRRNPGEGDFKESATENYRRESGKVEKAG